MSGYKSGFESFWPSNKMHDFMSYGDSVFLCNQNFLYLHVPYPQDSGRTCDYLQGKTFVEMENELHLL